MQSAPQIPNIEAFIKRLLTMNTCSVNAYQLFETTKIFFKPLSDDDTRAHNQQLTMTKAKSILERKLSQKFNGECNNFIGLLCIYIYILNSERSFCRSNLTKNFSTNLTRTLKKIYELWKKNRETPEERSCLISLSTILFVLVTFVQKSEQNVQFTSEKIFSEPLISLFLKLRLPDDEKLLKSYQIILLYVMKKCSFVSDNGKQYRKLLIKSIISHVGLKKLSESTALILAGFLKRSIKNTKLGQLKEELESVGLMKRLKEWTLQIKDLNRVAIILEIFEKLNSKNPDVKNGDLSLQEFFEIYNKFSGKKESIEDQELLFIKLVRLVNYSERDEYGNNLLKDIITNRIITTETIKLQVLRILLPHLEIVFLVKLCGEGFISYLDSIIQEINFTENVKITENPILSIKISLSLEILFIILQRFQGSSVNLFMMMSSKMKWILENMTPEVKGINFPTFYELKLMFRQFRNNQNFLY